MKQRILFVDHSLHNKTGSSRFFQELLEHSFEVQVVHIEPGNAILPDIITDKDLFDIALIWQMDFLAPIFISRGIPTVVVPMYDGSSNMPDLHWQWSSAALFINFSWNLHERIRMMGCKSLYVKYFPKPVDRQELPQFEYLDVFLWQRRPKEGINARSILRLFGNQIRRLHIHDAPDEKDTDGLQYYKDITCNCQISSSQWFLNRFEYEEIIGRHNVFVAPRRSEGIGMAHLESMSRGMLTVANDMPTHNEYISNWLNGVLFNADDIGFANFDLNHIAKMAYIGWMTVREGHNKWLAQHGEIVDFINSASTPKMESDEVTHGLFSELPKAYVASYDYYDKYLKRNARLIKNMGLAARNGHIRSDVEVDFIKRTEDVAILTENVIDFREGKARVYLAAGWGHDEVSHVWMLGHSSTLWFRPLFRLDDITGLIIVAWTPFEMRHTNKLRIFINDIFCGHIDVNSNIEEFQFEIPKFVIQHINKIMFYAEDTIHVNDDKRDLSVAFSSIKFI